MKAILYIASLTVGLIAATALSGCVQKAPPELLQALEDLDRQLVEVQGAEFAPQEYAVFVQHWGALKGKLTAGDDEIRWPWEGNPLVTALHQAHAEGVKAATTALQRREAERVEAERQLALLEGRLHAFTSRVDDMGSRLVLGKRPVETELLVRQARSFMDQGLYSRSARAAQDASKLMDDQTVMLANALGRYADEGKVDAWRQMAQRTIEWSRTHHAAAIVVSKADRRLTLYRAGRAVLSYPVRLGYNGMLEKRFQGDGATPEGLYRVTRKRDRGDTQFHRAFLLDYPNGEDRRRFQRARMEGRLPDEARIGGEIEIHGEDNPLLSQTLGCVMLSNPQIDALFADVEVGTPVAIVGALSRTNLVAQSLAALEQPQEES